MTDEQIRGLEDRLDANALAVQAVAEKLDQVRVTDLPAIRVDIADLRSTSRMVRVTDLQAMRIDIAGLQTSARIWGAVAGILGGAIVAAILRLIMK